MTLHTSASCKNNKLMFPVYRTCAENHQTECYYTDDERTLTGTWVTDEVKKALEIGYEIKKIYEVWHFEHTERYNPEIKSDGLFTNYVNTFLKLKQESSGWPEWCETKGDKERYINDYHEKEGILLEYKNIKKNPGMRNLENSY